MSNFLAEAQVLIRPDTSKFRAELLAELTAVTRALPPIPVAVVATAAGATSGLAAQAAASEAAAAAAVGLSRAELQAAGGAAALDAQAKKTSASLVGLGSATGRLDAALLGLRTALGSSAVIGLGAGALAAIALGKALRASSDLAADFETQMNVLAATTGASAEQINEAAEAARQLGEDASLPAVSAGDAAQAITELSKAGLDLQNSITGARGVLELATAANLDNAAATELAANALNAFGLAADQTTHVADALANASVAAQGSIGDVGIALQQSAAAAAQVGISFEDTVALLTLLAQGGLRASDAGTSLRVGLLRLAAPTTEAQAILQQLNIQVRDLQGNIRPQVFAEFGAATARLSPELRDAAAAAVFGQDAFRAFALISREGAAGLTEAQSAIAQSGTAAELAGARTQGFAGALGALQSEAETLGVTLGQLLNTSLLPLIGAFSAIVGAANRASEAIRSFAEINIPLVGELGERFAQLFKIIGPFAVFRLPVQGIETFNKVVSGAGTVTEQLNARLEDTRSKLDLALATGRTDQVEALRRQIGELERALDALGGEAGASLGQGILAASDTETRRGFEAFRSRFDEFGDAATRQAEQIGEDIGGAVGEGMKKALDESVVDAINSAKSNLFSIGADLASQIGQLIDAGPLGQQLQRLQDSLAERRGARQRLGLLQDLEDAQRQLKLAQLEAGPLSQALDRLQSQLDKLRQTDTQAGAAAALRQAQTELREARESVSGVGDVTPRERRAIQEFLAPFIENVRSAKSALQQQNLEGRIDKLNQKIADRRELFAEDEVATARRRVAAIKQAIQDFDDQAVIQNLQKVIETQKKAVAAGIANLITQFEQGEIKFAQFAARLAKITGPYAAAGKALGIAFNAAFQKQIEGILEQAKQIAIGTAAGPAPGAAGVPGPTVVSVQAALLEAQKETAENTSSMAEDIKKLPERIAEALRRQQAPPSKPAAGSPR